MGDMVHQALEKLYSMLKFQKTMSVEEVIIFYNQLWKKEYVPEILVAKASQGLTAEDYRKMGEKFLIDYYFKHTPFNDLTIIGLETQDRMTLPDGNSWHVRIDKLGFDSEGNYYVCDYKTNSRMKAQSEADSDRQLAMYSIWVRNKFKDARRVILRWHMLAFNSDVDSSRTDKELNHLQNEIVEKIKEIESATQFPTNKTALCNYCVFKDICPVFGHKTMTEEQTSLSKFKKEDGTRMVDEYAKIVNERKALEEKEEKLKEDLIEFAKEFELENIYGNDMIVSVKGFNKVVMPEDKTKLIAKLKEIGLYEELTSINFMKLQSMVKKGELSDSIKDMLGVMKNWRVGLAKKKD